MRNQPEKKNTDEAAKGPDRKQEEHTPVKHKVSALQAASLGRSATDQVNRHSDSGLANTGTNISYEGATAPGGGGSAGTGYTSGKPGVDEKINSESDYDEARVGKPNKGSSKDKL